MVFVALKVVEYSRSWWLIVLVECPACGYRFDRHKRRFLHFVGHDLEDVSLSQLGSTPGYDEPPVVFDDDARRHRRVVCRFQ